MAWNVPVHSRTPQSFFAHQALGQDVKKARESGFNTSRSYRESTACGSAHVVYAMSVLLEHTGVILAENSGVTGVGTMWQFLRLDRVNRDFKSQEPSPLRARVIAYTRARIDFVTDVFLVWGRGWAFSDAMRSEVLLLPAPRLVIAGARKSEPAFSLRPLTAVSRPIYKSRLADTKSDVFAGAGGSFNNGLAEDLSGSCEN